MKQIIKQSSPKNHYIADACIIWCFDDRFSELLKSFIEKKQFSHIDLVKVAGGVKDLASFTNVSAEAYLIDQIAKSIKLHHAPLIILMAHEDCGAYGGSTDMEFCEAELKKATRVVQEKFPNIAVESYCAAFDGLSRI